MLEELERFRIQRGVLERKSHPIDSERRDGGRTKRSDILHLASLNHLVEKKIGKICDRRFHLVGDTWCEERFKQPSIAGVFFAVQASRDNRVWSALRRNQRERS